MTKNNSCSQLRIITRVTAIACFLSMLLCYKLWLSERNFPLSPVSDFLPAIPAPFDFFLFCIAAGLLICIAVFRAPQKFIIAFIILAALFAIQDQNRWQPWFYQYLMMFFVLSFFNFRCDDVKQQNAIITIFKLMIACIYFWSGLQKMNAHFLGDTFPWLMEPITNHMSAGGIDHFKWLGYLFPLMEFLTGICLLIQPLRKIALAMVVIMHLFILFALGPFGHNYNPVVWPWNFAMISFSILLFYKSEAISLLQLRSMLRYHSLKLVAILFIMMPLFNFFNLWDSYLSHNLYSGNTSNGVIYISDSVENRLPEHIKPYSNGEMNQNQINIKYWCMQELGVPAYPEKRNFEAVANTLYPYAKDSAEIYLMFSPKLKLNNLN
jgi:uncharacterized membrane protein YphA (DoxX/SURF4 family)